MPHAFWEIANIRVDVHFVSQGIFPITVFRMVSRIKERRIIIMIRLEHLQSHSKLPNIVRTLNSQRFSFRLRNSRQQKRSKNCDDGNDHQQFNQRERRIFFIRVHLCFICG